MEDDDITHSVAFVMAQRIYAMGVLTDDNIEEFLGLRRYIRVDERDAFNEMAEGIALREP